MKLHFIFILLAMLSCASSTKHQSLPCIKLSIMPSSGGNEGYLIQIKNDTLFLAAEQDGIDVKQNVLLSNIQKDSVSIFVKQLMLIDSAEMDHAYSALDSWIYSLKIDDKEFVLNKASLYMEPYNDEMKNLQMFIKYLIQLSPVAIILRGFS